MIVKFAISLVLLASTPACNPCHVSPPRLPRCSAHPWWYYVPPFHCTP